MKIKKFIWILASLLLIIVFIFSYSSIKKHFAMKEIQDIQTEEKDENTEETEPQNEKEEPVEKQEEEDTSEEASAEDPIKDYLSEKVNKAMKRLFKNDIKITAIGDSLTQGVGDETDNNGYVGILENTINQDKDLIDIQNLGKRGNRTNQMIERMEKSEVKEELRESDIILITIGANDIMQIFKENVADLKLDQFTKGKIKYENNLHYIFSEMEKNNAHAEIYLIGFYNPFKQYFADIRELEIIVNEWNAVGEEVTNEYDQVSYIPIKDLFEDTSINYFSDDNFHPNHLGYELIAEQVLESIVNEGEHDEQEK